MRDTWQRTIATALGVIALALVLVNGWLATGNRTVQGEVNQRQMFLQQTGPLEVLYREMVKALADLAVQAGDRPVLEALQSQGINITVNAPAPGPASPAAPRK